MKKMIVAAFVLLVSSSVIADTPKKEMTSKETAKIAGRTAVALAELGACLFFAHKLIVYAKEETDEGEILFSSAFLAYLGFLTVQDIKNVCLMYKGTAGQKSSENQNDLKVKEAKHRTAIKLLGCSAFGTVNLFLSEQLGSGLWETYESSVHHFDTQDLAFGVFAQMLLRSGISNLLKAKDHFKELVFAKSSTDQLSEVS